MMTGASPVLVPREDAVGKIFFAVAALTFGLAFFTALMMLIAAVFKGQTGRCRAIISEAPYRALLIGAVGYAVFGGLARYFYSMAFIKRLLESEIVPSMLGTSITFVVVLALFTLAGATGTFAAVGDRLEGLNGRPISGLPRFVLGTLTAAMAGLFPVIGWGVVIPLLFFFSFGSAVLSLVPGVRRKLAQDSDA